MTLLARGWHGMPISPEVAYPPLCIIFVTEHYIFFHISSGQINAHRNDQGIDNMLKTTHRAIYCESDIKNAATEARLSDDQ
jgi:hypothetical protein